MTHEEINRRIAKLCGWEAVETLVVKNMWELQNGNKRLGHCGGLSAEHAWACFCPKYASSLDACVEFESKLTGDDRSLYLDFIYLHTLRLNNEAVMGFENQWGMFTASPFQRCEAFLRMKRQWPVTEPAPLPA